MDPLILALLQAGVIDLETAERLDRQLDPARARVWAETLLTDRYAAGLSAQQSRLLDLLRTNRYTVTDGQVAAFFSEENRLLNQTIAGGLEDVLTERGLTAAVIAGNSDPFAFVNRQLLTWLDDYYLNADVDLPGSVGQLNLTSRTNVARAFREWYEGDLGGQADGLPQLIRALEPTFGPTRAESIGVTETTRIFARMTEAAEEANPETIGFEWSTARDERVCPWCSPMDGRQRRKGEPWIHPAMGAIEHPPHPRCRCDVTPITTALERVR